MNQACPLPVTTWTTEQQSSYFSRHFLTLSLFQDWLGTRNMTVEAHFLKMPVRGGSWCTDCSLSPLLVKFTQVLKSLLYNQLNAVVIPISVACAPFPTTLFPSSQLWMCFDTALCEQTALSAMTFCDLPSLSSVMMIIILTTVKTAVLPMIIGCL